MITSVQPLPAQGTSGDPEEGGGVGGGGFSDVVLSILSFTELIQLRKSAFYFLDQGITSIIIKKALCRERLSTY